MFFVFCFSTVLGLINLQLWEWFFSLPFRILIYCLVVWSKYRVFQYGLANWLPWSSALTPKRNGSQTDMDRWQMYALSLGSTCHCHEQQWCCSPSGICSSKVASRWPTSENLVRELGNCWPCGISQEGTKELMLKKDAVSRGLGSVGLQFSLAHCGLNVLSKLTSCHWAKYLSPAQRAWATFLCSALTYLEGLYT